MNLRALSPRRLSLRGRLVSAAMVVVLVGIGAVSLVSFVAVRHELVGQVDTQLRRQAEAMQRRLPGGGPPPDRPASDRPRFGEPGDYTQTVAADGTTHRPSWQSVRLPVTATDRAVATGKLGAQLRDITLSGKHVRLLTTPGGQSADAVQVALPLSTVDGQLHRLEAIFAIVGVIGLLCAAAVAWLLSRTTLQPVASLTAAAERVAATRDLAHRIHSGRTDELGRLAASFDTMLEALEKSLAAQRQLVADASHELRTPLASLRTNVEVLRRVEELPPADREALLSSVVAQLDELTDLVGDVVELARGDEPPAQLQDTRLDQLVDHAVVRARRHWPAVRFEVTVTPAVARAEPARLDRAITNLLGNAAKFSPSGGVVHVRLEPTGMLTVRDQGPGIDPADLAHVFDRFYRSTSARGLPGSGLGLAIVKQVADAHGATVRLENAPGGGTVATLDLPATPVPLHLALRNTR